MTTRRRQGSRGSVVLFSLLAACTAINTQNAAPADWPALKVTVHAVKWGDMAGHCYQFVSPFWKALGSVPAGCATVRFDKMTCDIYVAEDLDNPGHPDPRDPVLGHEREHCQGLSHFGDDSLAQAWRKWKDSRK